MTSVPKRSAKVELLVEPWPIGTKISFWAVWTMVCVCFSTTVLVSIVFVSDFGSTSGEEEGCGVGDDSIF